MILPKYSVIWERRFRVYATPLKPDSALPYRQCKGQTKGSLDATVQRRHATNVLLTHLMACIARANVPRATLRATTEERQPCPPPGIMSISTPR